MGTQSYILKTGRNNTVPSQITTNNVTVTMDWDVLLRARSQTGPNGDAAGVEYDVADRPSSSTAPTGEVTVY